MKFNAISMFLSWLMLITLATSSSEKIPFSGMPKNAVFVFGVAEARMAEY
jgi:hypothetical protein